MSDKDLITIQHRPFNAETPFAALAGSRTPTGQFYVRSNFDVPVAGETVVDADTWPVLVGGAVASPRTVTLAELKRLPHRHVDATMECAGNGRKLMDPVPGGTPWGLGAVSTGRFTGVALRDALELCGALGDDVVEIAFEAADEGVVEGDVAGQGRRQPVRFARSMPIEQALHPDTLLAWSMNDEPLTPAHGYPLRVFVPGWYGMASVKWVTRIEARTTPFEGHFQTDRYVYIGDSDVLDGTPVTRMRVRALILSPESGATLSGDAIAAGVRVRGIAWSGFGAVRTVEVSDDGGRSWHAAVVTPAGSPYAASHWHFDWRPDAGWFADGRGIELIARATDEAGHVQPMESLYNRLGYGNNVVHRVRIDAE